MNSDASQPEGADPASVRRGYWHAHFFQFFNAIAFSIILGTPIIVYAKSLGASSTVLGILASFTPLLTVMQLPAAHFLDRFSYKEFVLGGWGLRTIFIFLVALVPVLGFLDSTSKLVLMMAGLFFFNLIRGISTAAFMPWITVIVPAHERGRFLSFDQSMVNIGCLVALLVSAVVMSDRVENWEYSVIFLLAAFAGVGSLYFVKRMPDAGRGDVVQRSAQRVPWRTILGYKPFRALMLFNVAYMLVVGGLAVFTVEYLREIPKFGVSQILFLSALSFLAASLTLPLTGRFIDHVGSKPVLYLALTLFAVVILGWSLLATTLLPVTNLTVGMLTFLSGLAGANFHLANSRMAMATMPEMGRNHFFALFTVVASLGLGGAPVIWGVSLDAIGTYELEVGQLVFRRHGIYFITLFFLNLGCFALVRQLVEPAQRSGAPHADQIYGAIKRLGRGWHR